MISFLASPKAFAGRSAIQQKAAVRSWLAVGVGIEVILYGDSPGTAAACVELGIRHVPYVEATKLGVPYFGAIADHAAEHARNDVQVYLNCDILLTPHILRAIEHIQFPHFLMIGQRIDLSEGIEINVSDSAILNDLNTLAHAGRIALHTPGGSDYFAFRRGTWKDLPPVVIGRGGYDNALIAYCLHQRIPVIDATLAVPAIHQFHEYGHTYGGSDEVFGGEDAKLNLANVPVDAIPVLEDADHLLRGSELTQTQCRGDHLRHLFMKFRYDDVPLLPSVLRELWRLQVIIGLRRQWEPTLYEVLESYNMSHQEALE